MRRSASSSPVLIVMKLAKRASSEASASRSKGSLTYAEIEEQIRCDVLGAKLADGSPASYNRNIAGKYWPKVIGGIVRC